MATLTITEEKFVGQKYPSGFEIKEGNSIVERCATLPAQNHGIAILLRLHVSYLVFIRALRVAPNGYALKADHSHLRNSSPQMGIPQELERHDRWVLWQSQTQGNRRAKVPVRPNKQFASVNNPEHWLSFDDVWSAYISGGFSGLDFCLAGDGLLFVDWEF